MAHSYKLTIIMVFVAAAIGGAALAQQPPDVVQSDVYGNTASGTGALLNLIPTGNACEGNRNTADGYRALINNTIGCDNTAVGNQTLYTNTTAGGNTAIGTLALYENGAGFDNTAIGAYTLQANATGAFNTASGSYAMASNIDGSYDTAIGSQALQANTHGQENTATGAGALSANLTGNYNTADGFQALLNSNGSNNASVGYQSLSAPGSGSSNAAVGFQALFHSTGSANIALGSSAGSNITTGSNNIEIGNVGMSTDHATIRIGANSIHKEVFFAGINSSKITGSAVYVTNNGRLGVLASSERYKTAIRPMDDANTAKLQQLRPVTFRLKTDIKGATQYGLIAEEVAKIYPELVTTDEKGHIDGVRYDELAPMLLNELQRQQRINSAQAAEIREIKSQLAVLIDLERELRAALPKHHDQFVAQR